MSVLLACMFEYHMHAWCPQRLEENTGSPRDGDMIGFELPCTSCELNPGSL